ncbi:hypothetical protein SAMN05216206_3863 [Pseudomonas guineae]|uniref:Heme utilization protein n=1 Tax=Pseudomonas guineae TaxID=425504 RepID=A0A1I3Q5Q5_9PSED|nr:hypothetical protein [Pseudomonas guineae]SFJ29015.1 hypothetical protein SAMN05216206_3863 [Pseudomonas guineae]|tara:strand:+ start:5030 stop:6028 length:999 start_codon:yes stop_codon:yes gene_type:complete
MKAQFMLKPLAFALAAVLSAGVYADQSGDRNRGPQNGGNASIVDSQNNHNNLVRNEGTVNDASVDGSLGNASGNVGVNVAAGDNNQQANAGAIAVADAYMVFGAAASANIDVDQTARNNTLRNFSVPNTASLSNSANGASGNVGINIAAGNYNQQKNDMAIGVSETAYAANAGVNVSQVSNGNVTNNNATLDYGSVAVSLSMNNVGGSYSGQSDQIGNVYPDIWTGDAHPAGSPDGHFDLDTATQGGSDLNDDGGALAFNEAGTLSLEGSASGFIPVVAGFNTAVVNTASLTNSLNGASGNVGVNVAAGGGNQQSNSLAVAVGCTACASSGE